MPRNTVTIHQASARWGAIQGLRPRLALAAMETQRHLPKNLQFPVSATLLLTTDADLRRLNRDFRGIGKPTNVLSFPQFTPGDLRRLKASTQTIELGDIAIGYQYVVAEAKEENKILINHITHLFIHGLLHLFGYDHMTDPDARRMERLETKIMAALDLPAPYALAETMEPKRNRKTAKIRSAARRSRR